MGFGTKSGVETVTITKAPAVAKSQLKKTHFNGKYLVNTAVGEGVI